MQDIVVLCKRRLFYRLKAFKQMCSFVVASGISGLKIRSSINAILNSPNSHTEMLRFNNTGKIIVIILMIIMVLIITIIMNNILLSYYMVKHSFFIPPVLVV